MVSPRVAIASGLAGAFAAALMLTGRLEGSIVTVVLLALVARAAPLAASTEPPVVVRALSRQGALVPAWVGIAIVACVRAGSIGLADVRGANAIAGLALTRGSALTIAACWVAVIAGLLALIAPLGGASSARGFAVSEAPFWRLELLGIAVQIAVLVSMFAGPQVRSIRDVAPWVVGAIAAGEALWFGRRFARAEWVARAATAAAVVAVVLAMFGGSL